MSDTINKSTIIIGTRGTGKTYYLREKVMPKVQMQKTLIVDTLDHPKYRDIPIMQPSQLAQWEAGTYRIITSNFDYLFPLLAEHIWNALLVFEDCTKYIRDRVPDPVRRFILDSKQKNLDLIFMYHGWGMVQPDMYRICDFVQIFKTGDTPEGRSQLIGHFTDVMEAYSYVRQSSNKHETAGVFIN